MHRTSTIDLVIASNEAELSIVEVASDLFTGSDHKTLYWEFNEKDRGNWKIDRRAIPR
jgi:hypothetical protein